jgi:hypothetical protein
MARDVDSIVARILPASVFDERKARRQIGNVTRPAQLAIRDAVGWFRQPASQHSLGTVDSQYPVISR